MTAPLGAANVNTKPKKSPDEIDWQSIARNSYEAYNQVSNWKNYQGLPMPQWDDLPANVRDAWLASAKESIKQYLLV